MNQVLMESLAQTDEFKLFFKYLFPVDRMFTHNVMFIETFLSNYDVNRVFNTTKETLKMVFMAMGMVNMFLSLRNT